MTAQEQDQVFEQWMGEHQGIVYKVACSFADSVPEQEDLAQEIRLTLWESVLAFDGKSKSSTYCYRIALNRAISWQRSKKSYQKRMARFAAETDEWVGPDKLDPRLSLIYEAIRTLNRAERSLILMYLDGFRYEEIAETLGLSLSNVGVRLTRIKSKLSQRLKGKQA